MIVIPHEPSVDSRFACLQITECGRHLRSA